MAIVIRDRFGFPFNNGRGIGTEQLDGTIKKDQLGANTGLREYVMITMVHDSTNNQITANIPDFGVQDVLEFPARLVGVFPQIIGRQADPLSLVVHNVNKPLQDRDGEAVGANLLSPGRIYELINFIPAFKFVQPLGIRLRDYTIYSTLSPDMDFSEVEILAGSTSDSDTIDDPIRTIQSYLAYWVPDDTPDISEILISGFNQIFSYGRIPGTIDVQGRSYKGWRSNSLLPVRASVRTVIIRQ